MLRKHYNTICNTRQGHKVRITKFWPLSLKSPYKPSYNFCYATTILTPELGVPVEAFFYYLNYFLIIRCGLSLYVLIMFFRLQNSPHFRERLLRHSLPISLLILRKKTGCFTVYMFFKVFLSLYIHVRFYHPKRGCPTARKAGIQVLDSGFSTVDSGFQVLGS